MGTLAAVSANRTAGTPPGDTTATPTESDPAANPLSTARWALINLDFWDIIFFKKSERCGNIEYQSRQLSLPGTDLVLFLIPMTGSETFLEEIYQE
jgi:hypothetical protein